MHINRKLGEQIEVDWAGDPAYISDPETGEPKKAFVFVGVLSYSHYADAETFEDEKQKSWVKAHVHMFEYFGGISKILVPDNCKTAVLHNRKFENELNKVYQELTEHYGTAIIPARVRTPKDKPAAEGSVGNISTWIIAALRNQTFFSLAELNFAIRKKLEEYNTKPFQKKACSRKSLFDQEEKQFLLPLPENAEYSTKFVRMPDLLIDLQTAVENKNLPRVMKKYTQPVLLIIDERLLLKPTAEEEKLLFEVIHRRASKVSTIFCSQYRPSEWYDRLGGTGSQLTDSILDRIIHNAYQLNIESTDPEKDISMREIYNRIKN